ncbi:MAG: nicotinate-nucleotide adenylyltransferase [Planctomycetota bacterium]|nr:MAG: nicotinate-nucleotide adenylyltransferase [Planctomycetota bacterium]
MRLGIYGGTFDPIHFGHLLLAERCREILQLDEVWFVPAAVSPHKIDRVVTPGRARVEMLEFALAGFPEFKVSRLETSRPGPSFTVQTLEQIQQADPTRELFLLMGADAVADLGSWREPERILQLSQVVAVNRAGESPNLTSLQGLLQQTRRTIQTVEMPAVPYSASEIRQRVATGQSIRFLTPRPVEMYIRQKGLYQPGPGAA